MPKYLIDCISTFRIRYVVEANELEHAYDEVIMREGDDNFAEFSQEHMGQMTIGGREIDDAEYLRQFDEDNDYLKGWPEEDKFQFVNKVDYGD